MTADHIARRNRANASKSTGPRTPAGKAAVAGNARRHGATARPDPGRVGLWLKIILDRPDLTLESFIAGDERSFRALALAQAEARLEACEKALRDYEAGGSETNACDTGAQLFNDTELLTRAFSGQRLSRSENRTVMALIGALFDPRAARRLQDRGRLLRRYRNEARARRKKAFAAWVDCPREAEATPPAPCPNSPETPPQRTSKPQNPETKPDCRRAEEPRIPKRRRIRFPETPNSRNKPGFDSERSDSRNKASLAKGRKTRLRTLRNTEFPKQSQMNARESGPTQKIQNAKLNQLVK